MKLRRLKIAVESAGGSFESNIPFKDGLVVIRADNTRGKSTCFKSILVALGLEAMLTTSQSDLPLTPAVTNKIEWNGVQYDVLESNVYLEIENDFQETITVHRTIKGERDRRLMTIIYGPALSEPGHYASADFFVNRDGAATREAGFHRELIKFLKWSLPMVSTYDDRECPLYVQLIFPFVFVEQKRGWSTIQPPLPTRFGVREPHHRVVEFLLRLDAYEIALRRQQLRTDRSKVITEWSGLHEKAAGTAGTIQGEIRRLPKLPTAKWPPEVSPAIVIPSNDNWIHLTDAITEKKKHRNRLVNQEIPKVQEISDTAESELSHLQTVVREREVLLSRLLNTLQLEKEEVEATRKRLSAIKEDLIQNKDARTLNEMGSKKDFDLNRGTCPVCHQSIPDSLVPLKSKQPVMSLDENIDFLEEQKKTFELVLGDAERAVAARERQVSAIRGETAELRSQIRSIHQTLVSDGRLPSEAAIRTRITLEQSIEQYSEVERRFQEVLEELAGKAEQWKNIESDLKALPKDDVSTADKSKIATLTEILRKQLSDYGFSSLPVDEIYISTDSYLPEHDGFDLQASISASDLIRTIWAYLMGMQELARSENTNHPGLLIFDEPRQQSANKVSFGQLMMRGASSGEHNQQTIVFTSEELHQLTECLRGLDHDLINFGDERMLQPVV